MTSLDRYQIEQIKNITNLLPGNERNTLRNIIENMDKKIKSRERDYNDLNKECSNLYDEYKKLEKKVSQMMLNQNKVDEISNENNFYKQQLNGTETEPGFIKLLAEKNNNLENFNNINNIEGMSIIEGITTKELGDVINENKLLESQIQKNQNNYSADDTQVFYKQQQFYRQQNFNYFLIILFYFLILILGIYLFFFKNNMSIYFKIFITILLAIYPFIIEIIEFFVYFALYYVYALVNGVPFDLGNYYGFTFK
jgi:hypothetical protein